MTLRRVGPPGQPHGTGRLPLVPPLQAGTHHEGRRARSKRPPLNYLTLNHPVNARKQIINTPLITYCLTSSPIAPVLQLRSAVPDCALLRRLDKSGGARAENYPAIFSFCPRKFSLFLPHHSSLSRRLPAGARRFLPNSAPFARPPINSLPR